MVDQDVDEFAERLGTLQGPMCCGGIMHFAELSSQVFPKITGMTENMNLDTRTIGLYIILIP